MRYIDDEPNYSFMYGPRTTPEQLGPELFDPRMQRSSEIEPFEEPMKPSITEPTHMEPCDEPMNKPSIPEPTPVLTNKISMGMYALLAVCLVNMTLTIYRLHLTIYGNGNCPA
jgi:hypothetical protein